MLIFLSAVVLITKRDLNVGKIYSSAVSASLPVSSAMLDFGFGDKSSIIFNFHARFPRLFFSVAIFPSFGVLALGSLAVLV